MTTKGTHKFEYIEGLPSEASSTLGTCGVEQSRFAIVLVVAMALFVLWKLVSFVSLAGLFLALAVLFLVILYSGLCER